MIASKKGEVWRLRRAMGEDLSEFIMFLIKKEVVLSGQPLLKNCYSVVLINRKHPEQERLSEGRSDPVEVASNHF